MKTKYSSILYLLTLVFMVPGLSGCDDKEDEFTGEPFFSVENLDNLVLPQGGVDVSTFSKGKKYVVRANGKWQLIPTDKTGMDWAKIFPMEGEHDGLIRIYCEENMSPLERVASYKILLNGVEQPQTIEFSQTGCEPYLNVSTAQVTLKRKGGEVSITVDANFEWECAIEGENASRFRAEAKSDTELSINTDMVNASGEDISAELIVKGKGEFANIEKRVDIVQLYATFFDDFSWLPNPKAGILGWNANGAEAGMSSWTEEQIAHGWTSISTWFYYRDKFVKFGKGGYGGDACSPAVPEIGGPSNVTVSWSALGYATGKNVKDQHDMFYVAVLGPGKIIRCSAQGALGHAMPYRDASGRNVTLEAVRFTLDENAWMLKSVDPTATVIWQTPSAQFSIDVEGMDGTSRVVFVAGPGTLDNLYQDPNGWNSRLFMDNFKIIVN